MSVEINLEDPLPFSGKVIGPIVDWITLTIDGAAAIEAQSSGSHSAYNANAAGYWSGLYSLLYSALSDKDVATFVSSKLKKVGGYKLNAELMIAEGYSPVYVHANPSNPNARPLRLTFNPSSLPIGWPHMLAQAWSELDLGEIPMPALLHDAKISRLDVAFDIVGLRPCEMFVTHPKLNKIWTASSISEGFETQLFFLSNGKSKSPHVSFKKRADAMLYDKKLQQKALGKAPIFGAEEHARLEFSLPKGKAISKLTNETWPFGSWRVGRVTANAFVQDAATQIAFFDALRIRGISSAVEALPYEFSTFDYGKDFAILGPTDILNGVELWAKWEEALFVSGLATIIAWTKTPMKVLLA